MKPDYTLLIAISILPVVCIVWLFIGDYVKQSAKYIHNLVRELRILINLFR